MPSETQTTTGHCAAHGDVEATRPMPKMGFPFVYYAIVRKLAQRKPYRCPTCGEPVEVERDID